jgi:hypothetical protein
MAAAAPDQPIVAEGPPEEGGASKWPAVAGELPATTFAAEGELEEEAEKENEEQEEQEEENWWVWADSPEGGSFTVTVDAQTTGHDFKTLVRQMCGFSVARQELRFKGEVIGDDLQLEFYGIGPDDHVTVGLLSSRAASGQETSQSRRRLSVVEGFNLEYEKRQRTLQAKEADV